jgi:undecaprenyl diphosphate synthase
MASAKGLHVAIIMDGNGRWAQRRGKPRVEGHRAGARAVRRSIEAAPALGIGTLTLYAFSTENWKRPPHEVNALMTLFRRHLASETPQCVEKGIRLKVVGRRDRLDAALLAAIEEAEKATAAGCCCASPSTTPRKTRFCGRSPRSGRAGRPAAKTSRGRLLRLSTMRRGRRRSTC